jgi:hypothetical protein
MMDCDKFREVVTDLDRPGVLPAEWRESAFAHAESCSDCGQLLTETELLDSELRRLIARDGDSQAPERLETHLLNAFRQRNLVARRNATWRHATAIGIGASLLLAFGFWLNRRMTDNRGLPGLKVRQPVVAVVPAVQGSSNASSGSAHANARERAARRPASTATKRDSANPDAFASDADSAAGFIALPDADPEPLDDGAVVRVEMPRAALASFGLPVEAMEGSGTVRADLVVSADGTPQAIRLLSQDDTTVAQR